MLAPFALIHRAARGLRLMAVLAIGLPLFLSGCKKAPYIETVNQTLYLGLPQNLDHVASLDMNRLRSRDIFKDFIASYSQSASDKAQLDDLRKKMGFDPINDVNLIVMGSRGKFAGPAGHFSNTVFIMRGNFADPAARLESMRSYLAEEYLIAPPPFREGTYPNTEYKTYTTSAKSQYDEKVTYSLNFGFPSSDMMVFSFSSDLMGEALDTISGGTPGIGADKAWLQMLGRPAIGAILWGTGRFDASMLGDAAKADPQLSLSSVDQYYFSLDSTARLEAHLGLVCKTIDNAVSLSDAFKKGLPQLQQVSTALLGSTFPETSKIPGKLTILPKGETVEIQLPLTDDESRAIRDEIRKSMNGIGPGGAK